MSDEENGSVFSRREDYQRRVPVATLPLPAKLFSNGRDIYLIRAVTFATTVRLHARL